MLTTNYSNASVLQRALRSRNVNLRLSKVLEPVFATFVLYLCFSSLRLCQVNFTNLRKAAGGGQNQNTLFQVIFAKLVLYFYIFYIYIYITDIRNKMRIISREKKLYLLLVLQNFTLRKYNQFNIRLNKLRTKILP